MDNLELYNKVRSVPATAKKTIEAGRQAGKTDINPMWSIKTLTEQFGPCGIGWKTKILRTWLESGANDEVAAHVEIELYVKIDGAWSEAIPGLGGSMFVAKERNGMYTDDDAYKKAYTDAISVACKALGIAADVYYEKDATKYDARQTGTNAEQKPPQKQSATVTETTIRVRQIEQLTKGTKYTVATANDYAAKKYGKRHIDDLNEAQYSDLYNALDAAIKKEATNGNN